MPCFILWCRRHVQRSAAQRSYKVQTRPRLHEAPPPLTQTRMTSRCHCSLSGRAPAAAPATNAASNRTAAEPGRRARYSCGQREGLSRMGGWLEAWAPDLQHALCCVSLASIRAANPRSPPAAPRPPTGQPFRPSLSTARRLPAPGPPMSRPAPTRSSWESSARRWGASMPAHATHASLATSSSHGSWLRAGRARARAAAQQFSGMQHTHRQPPGAPRTRFSHANTAQHCASHGPTPDGRDGWEPLGRGQPQDGRNAACGAQRRRGRLLLRRLLRLLLRLLLRAEIPLIRQICPAGPARLSRCGLARRRGAGRRSWCRSGPLGHGGGARGGGLCRPRLLLSAANALRRRVASRAGVFPPQ